MIGDWAANETCCHNHFRNKIYGDDLCWIFVEFMCSNRKWIKNLNFE